MVQLSLLDEPIAALDGYGRVYLCWRIDPMGRAIWKLGYTGVRVLVRMGQLRAVLIGDINGTRAHERELLDRFRPWHIEREWHRLPDTPTGLGDLRELCGRFGGPEGLAEYDKLVAANLAPAAATTTLDTRL